MFNTQQHNRAGDTVESRYIHVRVSTEHYARYYYHIERVEEQGMADGAVHIADRIH